MKIQNFTLGETRMMQRNDANTPEDSTVLHASRVGARIIPLPDVKREHNAGHRTTSNDTIVIDETGRRVYSQPTAQPPSSKGDGTVYTKSPDWRDRKAVTLQEYARQKEDTGGKVKSTIDEMTTMTEETTNGLIRILQDLFSSPKK